jgi:uncharacterized protein (DUF608 family)
LCFNLQNFIGTDGKFGTARKNMNVYQKNDQVQGIYMYSNGTDSCDERFGSIALTTKASNTASYRTSWIDNTLWFQTHVLNFWQDFSKDGTLDENPAGTQDAPAASLAVKATLAPKDSTVIEFFVTWHFPNRQKMTWGPTQFPPECENKENRVGNYYTRNYKNAWDVAGKVIPQLKSLEERSLAFVKAFHASSMPQPIKEAALFNISNLRSQTVFRADDGNLFGYEGYLENGGSWPGNCTHVWNYEQATPFLFGELAKTMRDVEYTYATDTNGFMSFRVSQPLSKGAAYKQAAADGQMGCVMKLYRDWQLSNDEAMLKKLWPAARKSLEFAWIKGGWDENEDGVMEGCQHNTMDVEYFGPNPQMGTWYLGALKAASLMGDHLGDTVFSKKCLRIFASGKKWIESNLFNGAYFEHKIMAPKDYTKVRPELIMHKTIYQGDIPSYQLGEGCLVDQLVGQYMAHICGLGYLVDSTQVAKTLQSIMKNNFTSMKSQLNNMRGYALGDETGLLMATYPKGTKMKFPFPYYNEMMTGFEYATASHMMYEGMVREGTKCFDAVRNRYDGRKRNPFNEIEAGYHYARAMASWAGVLAYTGFHYSAVTQTLMLKPVEGTNIWSHGYGWGTFKINKTKDKKLSVTITAGQGTIGVKHLIIKGKGAINLKEAIIIKQGSVYTFY